ncbi:MAG: ABC transporter permease [Betaproteobacteria bacterium]|nr:MAG: ABC transporter permease [Betaproteobacteria bacterium]
MGATISSARLAALDSSALKAGLRRAERSQKLHAIVLVAPLLLFLALNFVLPIGSMLLRSIQDPEMSTVLPGTAALLRGLEGGALPDDHIADVFVTELRQTRDTGALSAVANRLNYDINGFRTLVFRTARQLGDETAPATLDELIRIDPRWGQHETWAALKHASGPYTSFYLLAAVDRRLTADGAITRTPAQQAIFVDVFKRTFGVSAVVTLVCLVLAYPVAYLLATVPARIGNLLMILVLLPFWTSVLVRTTAWMVLLQREGIVNGILRGAGVISEPLQLIHNRTGVYIAMTYVLLPFMVLPLYGVMKGISPLPVRAALSLGASPFAAFRRVYLPQTLPGITAGCLLVFILAIGYYITPALVGGADDQLISYFIAFYTNQTLNWGMAAALGLVLLAVTLILYGVYAKLAGTSGLKWR